MYNPKIRFYLELYEIYFTTSPKNVKGFSTFFRAKERAIVQTAAHQGFPWGKLSRVSVTDEGKARLKMSSTTEIIR